MTKSENDREQPLPTNLSIRDVVTFKRENVQLEMLNESPPSADTPQTESDASSFQKELRQLINRHSRENDSNTPDWILARFMQESLNAFEQATRQRDRWFRHSVRPEHGKASST